MMREINLNDGSKAQVSNEDWLWLSGYNWCLNAKGYPVAWVEGRVQCMHKLIAERMGLAGEIDHRDRNKSNAQRDNLREATSSQNKWNQGPRQNNKVGFKGVSFHKGLHKYQAQIMVNGRRIHLGTFETATEAASARNAAEVEYFGEFAFVPEAS